MSEQETVREFSEHEIQAAIANYRQQAAMAAKQLQELERQAEVVQAQQHMINGAILAFESLLQSPVPPGPEPPPEDTANGT